MALAAISIPTTSSSDLPAAPRTAQVDEVKQAVRNVFAAMRLDFGAQFARQFDRIADPMAISENAWMRRLFQRIGDVEPGDVVDGYDRCVSERKPYMPTLLEIAECVARVRNERLRAAEQVAKATAPRFGGGIAGYVEHVLAPAAQDDWAKQHIGLMREVLQRPPARTREERAARLEQSLVDHAALMANAPPLCHRGQYHGCAVPGCPRPGTHTHSHGGLNAVWFCIDHWRKP